MKSSGYKTSGYNLYRDDTALLEEHIKSPPSFSVHLYPSHWTLNNGSKFLYNNHVSSILEDIRAFRIPTDFIQLFDEANVPYYNGCLVVELLDYRPQKVKDPVLEKPDVQRVVLRPSPETIWADICLMNAKAGSTWSDAEALEVEARILMSTSIPLCLEPDPHLTRVVNSILRVSTPNVPNSLKRKAAAMADLEEDETEKAKRAKMLQFMNPQTSPGRKPFQPSYKTLALIEKHRAEKLDAALQQQQQQQQMAATRPSSAIGPSAPAPPVPLAVNISIPNHNGTNQDQDGKPAPDSAPVATNPQTASSNAIPQPAPMAMPPAHIPPHLQPIVDPAQRRSPVKQQQHSNAPSPQRPPSQPVNIPQPNVLNANTAPQASAPQQPQPASFNPPIPSVSFLHQPPTGRRMSAAQKPITPATQNQPLPSQQQQHQTTNQTQTSGSGLPNPQLQTHLPSQPPSQPQPPPQPQPQTQTQPSQQPPPQQIPMSMHHFMQPNGRPMNLNMNTAMQRQLQSGRSTPANNPHSSPAPNTLNMTRSPMPATAKISGRSTPMPNTNGQAGRASPLVTNQPLAARTATPQTVNQQLPQTQPQPQMIAGVQQNMHPAVNSTQAYQWSMQQHMQMMRTQSAMAQNAGQQRQVPQAQLPAHPQPQQAGQEQPAAAQQFVSVPMTAQMYGYMQMNPATMQPNYMWPRGAMGRGVTMPPQMQNGQQQIPGVPVGMTPQQRQGIGRAMPGSLPNR